MREYSTQDTCLAFQILPEKLTPLSPTGDEPAPAGGASTDIGGMPESSKVEQEIEEGKTNAQEAETVPAAELEKPKSTLSNGGEKIEDGKAQAEVAAQVADSAEKLDGTPVPA